MMSEYRRELMFRVMDHQPSVLPMLHYLDQFTRCDEILKWLIDHQITGKIFLSFVHFEFPNSPLSMVKYILKRLKKSRDDGKIILGRDMQ
jgi:hypothetical protein